MVLSQHKVGQWHSLCSRGELLGIVYCPGMFGKTEIIILSLTLGVPPGFYSGRHTNQQTALRCGFRIVSWHLLSASFVLWRYHFQIILNTFITPLTTMHTISAPTLFPWWIPWCGEGTCMWSRVRVVSVGESASVMARFYRRSGYLDQTRSCGREMISLGLHWGRVRSGAVCSGLPWSIAVGVSTRVLFDMLKKSVSQLRI